MSLWEAQMLHSKGRLSLDRPFPAWLRLAAAPGVVAVLPPDVDVVVALDQLPPNFHGDPANPPLSAKLSAWFDPSTRGPNRRPCNRPMTPLYGRQSACG
jgi:hypothetical protein